MHADARQVCGRFFKERVIELRAGGVQSLVDSTTTSGQGIDVERMAGSQDHLGPTPSRTVQDSNPTARRSFQRDDNSVERQRDERNNCYQQVSNPGDKEFILVCRDKQSDTKLYHADITKAMCDFTSYHVLHAQYYGRFKMIWKWLTLKEIGSVDFVKVCSVTLLSSWFSRE